jgi:hypothetical protein
VALWIRKVEDVDYQLTDRMEVVWDRNTTFDYIRD